MAVPTAADTTPKQQGVPPQLIRREGNGWTVYGGGGPLAKGMALDHPAVTGWHLGDGKQTAVDLNNGSGAQQSFYDMYHAGTLPADLKRRIPLTDDPTMKANTLGVAESGQSLAPHATPITGTTPPPSWYTTPAGSGVPTAAAAASPADPFRTRDGTDDRDNKAGTGGGDVRPGEHARDVYRDPPPSSIRTVDERG